MVKSTANLTLKEKLHRHYDNRNFQPKDSSMTCFAISVVWVNMVSLVVEGLLVLLPSYYQSVDHGIDTRSNPSDGSRDVAESYRWAQAAVVWLFAETVCHWLFLRDGSGNIVQKYAREMPRRETGTLSGWRRCSECKLDAPPRSHHCSICQHCVLKRDHHCYFSGSCVGLHNQRHFIYFLMYVLLASIYAAYMQIAFILQKESVSYLFPPVAMWKMLTAQTKTLNFVIMIHLYLSVISVCASIGFMSWQFKIISKGQTSYEAMKGITKYRMRTLYDNFQRVFGSPFQCCLSFVLPIHPVLPGDGLDWTE